MDVCVIGAGNVGRGIIRDMLESDKNFKLKAFDIHEPSLVEAQKLDPERVSIGTLDAGDSNAVSDRVRGSSLVVNTTDGTQCLTILDGAIAAGVNYIDVHGTLLVKERLARHDAA
ncbi:MAG: saccharopine dehydrogenase NADP-binding domain-containing protein, partial [Rhodospirillales bacterium]